MNERLVWLLSLGALLCAVCSVTAYASERAPEKAGPLRVGWATTDITPPLPVHRSAGPSMDVSRSVMDPITATALVLESITEDGSGDMAVMVSCDLGMIRQELRDRVRELVAQSQPEIDVQKIVLMATHTHVAPCVRTSLDVAARLAEHGLEIPDEWSWFGVVPGEDIMSPTGFLDFAAPRIAKAVVEAWESRKPGGVSFGLGHAVVGHNRLTAYYGGRSQMYGATNRPDFSHVEGYEDHSVALLYTFDASGELTGVVVNLACPAQASGGSAITADFCHDMRIELRKRLGESLYILPQIAAAGDQSPAVLVDRRAEARMEKITGRNRRQQIAVRIADAVTSVLPLVEEQVDWAPVLAHRVEEVELSRRLVTEEEAESRRRDFERLLGEYRTMREEIDANPAIREKPRWFNPISAVHWRLARAARVVARYEQQQAEFLSERPYWRLQGQEKVDPNEAPKTTLPVPIHVIRIGEVAIATNPFELYLDFGIQTKARSKAVQTFVVQLANGYYQYLPTERSVARGAYGAIPESNQVSPEGGRELVEATLKLIEALWEE